MGELSKFREDIVETLELAGIKAVGYNEKKRIIPPCAIVTPDEPYLRFPTTTQRMRQTNVGIAIIVIGSNRGTDQQKTHELDDMIEKVHAVLSPYLDIATVSAPGKVKVEGKDYIGSVFLTEYQITLEGE